MDQETRTAFDVLVQRLSHIDRRLDGIEYRMFGIGIEQRLDGAEQRFREKADEVVKALCTTDCINSSVSDYWIVSTNAPPTGNCFRSIEPEYVGGNSGSGLSITQCSSPG